MNNVLKGVNNLKNYYNTKCKYAHTYLNKVQIGVVYVTLCFIIFYKIYKAIDKSDEWSAQNIIDTQGVSVKNETAFLAFREAVRIDCELF